MSDLNIEKLEKLESELPELGDHVISWKSAGGTDIGRVRPVNEDAYLDASNKGLWVVADGLGGHSRGDYASRAVVQALEKFESSSDLLTNLKSLESLLQEAHERCRNAFRNKRVGTTLAALFQHNQHCFFIWAGDSRVYRLRNNQFTLMTEDHSLAFDQFKRGELSEEELDVHPSAHTLTRAIGTQQKLRLSLLHEPLEPGDRYLICSDGLYNGVARTDLARLLGFGTPEEALKALIEHSLACCGKDNITAIVAQAYSPSN